MQCILDLIAIIILILVIFRLLLVTSLLATLVLLWYTLTDGSPKIEKSTNEAKDGLGITPMNHTSHITTLAVTETTESLTAKDQTAVTKTAELLTAKDHGVFNGLPIQDIAYNTSGLNTNRSVFVVPRRAYLDNRTVYINGQQRIIIAILAEIHDDALKSILACELNQEQSKVVNVIKEGSFTGWVRAHVEGCTHRVVVVQCMDFPIQSIINGSSTGLIYRKEGEDHYSRVETEKPLNLGRTTPSGGKGSIFVCSTLFGHPERLDNWLKYQKTLGVDSVHFNVDKSFAMTDYPFLNELLNNGFVQMEVWNDIVGSRMFYNGQIVKYQDCIYRYIGVYEYGLFIDVDDFFNPMLPNKKDIHYYFNEFFSSHKTGSVCFEWPQMQCAPSEKHYSALIGGNLTSILTGYETKTRPNRKCAHRLSATVLVKIHEVERSFPGYRFVNTNSHLAYIAHNNVNNKVCSLVTDSKP